jgi:hypothetical protein
MIKIATSSRRQKALVRLLALVRSLSNRKVVVPPVKVIDVLLNVRVVVLLTVPFQDA